MWSVLKQASEQPGVVVTVYVDGDKADAVKVKAQLPKATVYRVGRAAGGKPVVSHAKFIVIDHEMLLLTSANFSFSAENRNVEFGFLIRDVCARGVRGVHHDQASTALYTTSSDRLNGGNVQQVAALLARVLAVDLCGEWLRVASGESEGE
jgi:phosphatidylserine/phosphatidylglycerophosphate/cardiolipin synthase-like enzyme